MFTHFFEVWVTLIYENYCYIYNYITKGGLYYLIWKAVGTAPFYPLPPGIHSSTVNFQKLQKWIKITFSFGWGFIASTNFSYSPHYPDFNFDMNLSWELQSVSSTQALRGSRVIGITHSTFKGVSCAWCCWKQTTQACSPGLCPGLQNSKQQLGYERVWIRSQKTLVLVLNLPLACFLTLTKSLNLTVI